MKIGAEDFNGKDVRVSMQPENAAERCYLSRLVEALEKHNAHWHEWDDMYGQNGICLVVQKMPA